MPAKKKVLLINVTWRYGSTGAVCGSIFDACLESEDLEPFALYGRSYGERPESNVRLAASALYGKAQHFLAKLRGIPYGGAYWSTRRILRWIAEIKPDLVHVHCANGYFVNLYRLFSKLGSMGVPVVLTNHAQFYYTGYCAHHFECGKWKERGCHQCPHLSNPGTYFFDRTKKCFKKMRIALRSVSQLTAVSVSPWIEKESGSSLILKNAKQVMIPNGIDTSIFRYRPIPLGNRPFTILCVLPSLNSEIKGGVNLQPLLQALKRNCVIQLVGIRGDLPFRDERIKNVGPIRDSEKLADLYASADVHLLLSKAETFSMLVAESSACGTKTIGFCCGGPESVFDERFATFVPYGNVHALASAIDSAEREDEETRHHRSEEASRLFSQELMSHRYLCLYRDLLHLPLGEADSESIASAKV